VVVVVVVVELVLTMMVEAIAQGQIARQQSRRGRRGRGGIAQRGDQLSQTGKERQIASANVRHTSFVADGGGGSARGRGRRGIGHGLDGLLLDIGVDSHLPGGRVGGSQKRRVLGQPGDDCDKEDEVDEKREKGKGEREEQEAVDRRGVGLGKVKKKVRKVPPRLRGREDDGTG
jgi:hypothetical protein